MIYGRMSVIGSKADIRTYSASEAVVCHCHPRAIARMRIGLSTSNAMMAAAILRIAAT